jgi:hypothetical protein
MSSETFSPEEWTLLKELPFKDILAAVVVDVRGPIGAASKEMVVAARRLVRDATANYADNELIMGILQDVANDPADEEEISLDDELARQAAIVEALALSEKATILLSERIGEQESIEYRHWIFNASQAATNATRSGGFLGIGTDKVSDGEEEFLEQLRAALGLAESEEEA